MAEQVVAQTAFNAGLLSDYVSARSDTKVYERGGSVFENWLPTVEGPMVRRPGTDFIAPQADEDYSATLIPFHYSATQRYMLEFGQNTFRVFRDQSLVLASAHVPTTIQTITPANPLEVLLGTTAGLATGDSVFITGTACPEINDQFFRITIVSGFNITLDGVDGLSFTAQAVPQGTAQRVFKTSSPYTAAQAETLKFVQSGDVLYLACDGVPRYKLSRTADDVWTFAVVTGAEINTPDDQLGSWPPFAIENTSSIALYIAANTAPAGFTTVTAVNGSPFQASDVGRYLAISPRTSERGYGLVTAFISGTQVTVQVYSRFPYGTGVGSPFSQTVVGAGNETTQWAWSAFDATNGYPSAVSLFDGRLVWGGSSGDPTVEQLSVVDSYENHRPYDASATDPTKFAVNPTNGFKFRARAGTQDSVEWMASLDQLFIGTRSGEWTLETTDPLSAIGPANFRMRQRGRSGSRDGVTPVVVDSAVLFVQRAGRRLHEFVFRSDVNAYESPDMTRLSRNVTLGRVKRMAYQMEPNRILWVVLEDGSLVSFTYERAEEVTAWATHPMDGDIESVAVITSVDQDEDEVWITIKRTVNGRDRRYVEVLQHFWDDAEELATSVFSDSAVSYSGVAVSKLYGLLHLRGKTVKILADAAPVDEQVVDADGSITLDAPAETVVVGLPVVSRFRSMRPDFGGSALKAGTANGYRKRVRRLAFRLISSGQGLFFGPDFDTMVELQLRQSPAPMDETPALFTGDTGYVAMPGGFDLDGCVCLQFDEPLPCAIAGTYAKMQSEENE